MIKFIEDKELCIKLKEKGFDEGCILQFRGEDTQPVCQMGYELNYEKNSDYNNEDNYWLACPTYSQITDWLMDKHNLFIDISNGIMGYNWHINRKDLNGSLCYNKNLPYSEYYTCLTEAINQSLKLIKL